MKTIKNILCLVIIISSSFNIYGQQEPLYSQYYNSFNLINPAYAGAHDFFTITTNARSQWIGEPGAPKTGILSAHGNVGENMGAGFSVVYDKVSVLEETDIYADFSYTISTSRYSSLAFGIKAGGSFINVNLTELGLDDDPLFSQNINTFKPNVGAGIFFYTDEFYASFSALNLFNESYYDRKSGIVASASKNVLMYLSSGYNFELNDSFNLKPSFLTRYTKDVPLSTDLSLALLWMNKAELSISHRLGDSIGGIFQVRATESIKIGYTYETFTSNLSRYNNGSHEISLVFDIGKNYRRNQDKLIPLYW